MNEFLRSVPDVSWAGNSLQQFVTAGLVFVVVIVLLKIFQLFVLGRVKQYAKKSKNTIVDTIVSMIDNIGMSVYILVALYFSLQYLTLPDFVNTGLSVVISLAVLYEVAKFANQLVGFGVSFYLDRMHEEEESKAHARSMLKFLRGGVTAIIWIIGILLILSNQGVDVTSLVASLGIGGLAIALALQSVFSDLFSSFSLLVDKPFQVGDTITLGDKTGSVQKIGLKTTRIKTLRGEELVVSNKELTSAQVQNLARMERRREVQMIGTEYEVSAAVLRKIPKLVQQIIEGKPEASFDRCHLSGFGDFSINFEIVYHLETADYMTYMDVKQAINLELFETFEQEGIPFAYPTQVLYVKK